ncbi:3-dehydroquinate synthase [Roseomonas sp. NAR14]|uniref:Multifunctional fusion protein n=1 Tax=Roseomonas acroporae TaxID=2937791 RepID=A0A9X1Y520_9PROT|nr:3-dehydroquinate synthase [Roseomonas acroporae]
MPPRAAAAPRPPAAPANPWPAPWPTPWPRSVVVVGMPGAGKTSIGRRLANRLGLPFHDADVEIEAAAGLTVSEIFARYGEAHFRDGERRVIARLLSQGPIVLATGGGAYADPRTRQAVRESGAVSLWLRCPLPTLLRRVAGRDHRPMFVDADPVEVLTRLMERRHPHYAEADIVIACADESPETTTRRVLAALSEWQPPARLPVPLPGAAPRGYDIVTGEGLLRRAGGLLAPVLPTRRVAIVSDANVAALHGETLREGLAEAGIAVAAEVTVAPGEASKNMAEVGRVMDALLAAGIERRTAVIALGGGVVGDLAGFVAAITLRGLPFVQVPTTLLAQVDSSVGGKTGVNLAAGKNLAGAFHQPLMVLADTGTLATLPPRELRAGYAEVAKHGLLHGSFWDWCEAHGAEAVAGDPAALRHAVIESCRLKSAVVAEDEREETPDGGRALLNLGHTFGHALEAECGYGGALLHGEGVAIGLGLAAMLSARLGHCAYALPERVVAHLAACGLPARIHELNRRFSAATLLARMGRDKKVREGRLRFILLNRPGDAFVADDVPAETVLTLLRDEGCGP